MTSIHEALGRLWDANDHDRMVECDGRWASWGSVRSLTERIDRELTAAGCQTGGRVAVVLSNRMESVAASWSCSSLNPKSIVAPLLS